MGKRAIRVTVAWGALLCIGISALAVEPDLSSPKTAIKSLYEAVQAQDGDAVLKTFYAANEEERELARAFAGMIVAGRKLSGAAKERFGSAGEALGSGMMSAEEFSRLDQAELKETGDTATLAPLGRSRPIPFHRTEGRWQVAIREFANGELGLPRQTAMLKKVGAVFDEVAGEINAGKFATSQEAESVIQTRLANVLIRAATQATTQPATRGAKR
jgi:hypothetical protein